MRSEKNSLAVLSSKRTKVFSKTRANEAFALPVFLDAPASFFSAESSCSHDLKLDPKVERPVVNMEQLKQTMLQHESMFKEQLYELHRLYRVQSVLMEELKGKSSSCHRHSGSLSFNSSLPCNDDSFRVEEERSDSSRFMNSKHLPFNSVQIDVNKPCEDKFYENRLSIGNHSSQRPMIDLEKPAEDQTEIKEVDDRKPVLRNSFLGPVNECRPVPCASWQELICSFSPSKNASKLMFETNGNTICRDSGEESVPFPSIKLSNFEDPSVKEGRSTPSRKRPPATSLFGVDLVQESDNKHAQSTPRFSNSNHIRSEYQFSGSDSCERSSSQASKLPHWLNQDLQTASAPNMLPVNSARTWQHHTSSALWQSHGEKVSSSDEMASWAVQEYSNVWPRKGGFELKETFFKVAHGKGTCSGDNMDLTERKTRLLLHKLEQESNANDSVLLLPDRQGASLASAMNWPSSPLASSMHETDAAPVFPFKELPSDFKSWGSSVHPRYQHRTSTSIIRPQVSQSDVHNQKALNKFMNSSNPWDAIPTYEQIQEGVFTQGWQGSRQGDMQGDTGVFPSHAAKREVFSKRLDFSFMPTAADLDLTLGLDLNNNEAIGRIQRDDDFLSSEHLGIQSKPLRNDFDLNKQSGKVTDVESQANSSRFQQKFESFIGIEWGRSNVGKLPYLDQQGSLVSSNLKAVPDETTASTMSLKQQSMDSLVQMYGHHDTPDDELSRSAGICRGLFSGRSTDIPGLISCESTSTPIPRMEKSIDESGLKGEACQSIAVGQSPQELLFDGSSKVSRRRHKLLTAMFGCLENYHGDTPGQPLLAEKHVSINTCDSQNKDNVSEGDVETSEIADILLLLSLDLPLPTMRDNQKADGQAEEGLKWLADMIPQDGAQCVDAGMASSRVEEYTVLRGTNLYSEEIGGGEKVQDAFELAVLNLRPVDPGSEALCLEPRDRCDAAGECLLPFNLRRRSLRRGRSVKDFQKEMLPSIARLSRPEINEDLQIIEGLVKSATEAMASCLLPSKEDLPLSLPQLSSAKMPSKTKGFRIYKFGKPNGILRACSWGESTCRRRRMRRQRRVFLPQGY